MKDCKHEETEATKDGLRCLTCRCTTMFTHKIWVRPTVELKINKKFFNAVASGDKNFEVRKNDRNYQVGDLLLLKEFDSLGAAYTGRCAMVRVTFITDYAQQGNYVVLGIKRVEEESQMEKCVLCGGPKSERYNSIMADMIGAEEKLRKDATTLDNSFDEILVLKGEVCQLKEELATLKRKRDAMETVFKENTHRLEKINDALRDTLTTKDANIRELYFRLKNTAEACRSVLGC